MQKLENQDWIFHAASESIELQKGGAFVKVLLRSLDSIVNQTLAQIVAFADINFNLELIDPNSYSVPHLKSFWITAYSKLVKHHLSTSHKRYGVDVYDYHCQFPFSSELQKAVEVILKIQQGISSGKGIEFTIKLFYQQL